MASVAVEMSVPQLFDSRLPAPPCQGGSEIAEQVVSSLAEYGITCSPQVAQTVLALDEQGYNAHIIASTIGQGQQLVERVLTMGHRITRRAAMAGREVA